MLTADHRLCILKIKYIEGKLYFFINCRMLNEYSEIHLRRYRVSADFRFADSTKKIYSQFFKFSIEN